MIIIPQISPVALEIFGFGIRWYALAYIAAFILGYWTVKKLSRGTLDKKALDDLLTYVIIGTIAGGRLGYVLFYNFSYFVSHPLEIFMVWHGGMAFHGGLVGVILAVFLFALRRECAVKEGEVSHCKHVENAFCIFDMLAVAAPIGIFFGRVANFINMEVMGRATGGPLGVVFAGALDQTPRHASPLYEAMTEGVLLFIITLCLWRWTRLREYPGALASVFLVGYSVFRIFCEFFREPDIQIGFLTGWGLTMGMLLSVFMFVGGAVFFAYAIKFGRR
ncbi:MAG: prolipoprotein diacylglyceryl transferase [Alphaproteobacteria bacterium]|nr:prolipoprotein diacylglyceryl transferase [Alphaproteobacteria bacterium]MCL2757935.1 prolipoprotein diacylglyceryl transferase [Alphaproteobacteria bacterium]